MRFVGSSQELPLESYDKTQGKCTEISGEELCHMRRLTKLTTFIRLPNSSSCMLRVFAKTYIQLVFFFPLFFFFLFFLVAIRNKNVVKVKRLNFKVTVLMQICSFVKASI